MFKLICSDTIKLSQKQKLDILKLKKSHWNFSLKRQLEHFEKNFKKNDLNNLFYKKNKLIGYTGLRKTFFLKNKKKITFLLFDTLIIHKSFRKQKLANLLMEFNNAIIKDQKLTSRLICKKKLVGFYKKFGWKICNSKYLKPKNKNQKVMIFI